MKTLTFTFIFSLSVLIANANHAFSELNLKLYDNAPFTLVLNNQVYNTPSNNFNLNNLTPGKHYLQVIKQHYNHYGYSVPQVIFNGYVTVPASTKLFAMIDFYNRFNIINQAPVYYAYDNSGGYGNYTNYYGAGSCVPPVMAGMAPNAFQQLKFTVSNSSFDKNKLQIALQGISYGVSSQQVLELMSLLTFESNKLQLAKQAYQYTADQQNYYIINNGFTFSSSINALNHYINQF